MGEAERQGGSQDEPRFPNKMGRILLLAMEEVMGRNGINALLNLVNFKHLLENYPPNNFDMGFSFTESSRLMEALDEMYGMRGARGLALRIGRACFRIGVQDLGPMLGVADLAFRVMPFPMKLRVGFDAFAQVFVKFSDHRVRLEEEYETLYWIIERCGVCWQRQAATPVCHLAVGIIQEALFWLSGGRDFEVEEISCIAAGDETCTIRISKEPY